MMNLHAGEPLEGGRGDVVVLADPHDGRIGIEAGENRVADGHAGMAWGLARRRAASSRSISSTRF